MAEHQIRFEDGAAYERMMGVWSRLAGEVFLDWVAPSPGLRWIDVGWDSVSEGAAGVYTGRLKITVSNQPGSLSSLSTVIARHEGNISNLRIVNRSMDFFDMVIDVEVTDVKHLADITAALRATPAINAVERARN